MRDLFRRTKVMSHEVAQLLVLTVIADLSRLVMRQGLPGAWRWDHRGRGPWVQGSCSGRAGRPIPPIASSGWPDGPAMRRAVMASSLGDIPTTPVRRLMGLVECSLARCAAGKPVKSAAQTPNGFRHIFHRPATPTIAEARAGLRRAVFPARRALPYQHGGTCRRPDG